MFHQRLTKVLGAAFLAAHISGCFEGSDKDAKSGPAFDAAYIAAEADKGRLDPLLQLNAACTKEVESKGARGDVCAVQDKVRELRKPMNIRF